MTGTERKVFQKYYPPDYDPTKLPRAKGTRARQFVQRVMTPFNMQCNTCHEYIYKGKKFNMKRETVEGEDYLGLRLFRFYFKCPNCLAEITFKTDLENCDYQNEHGATRLFEAIKMYQDAEKAKEAQEEEDKKDPMKMLEKRTMMSRAEMEAMGNLEDLQEISRHKESVDVDDFLEATKPELTIAEQIKLQEEEDEALIRNIYGRTSDGKIMKRLDEEEEEEKPGTSGLLTTKEPPDIKPVDIKPTFSKDIPKRANDQKALLSKLVTVKKKKVEVKEEPVDDLPIPPPSTSTRSEMKPSSGLLGLCGYGSGSGTDSD
ncbi:hypothetical protein RB195_008195 [Necator americanus]|uniref:Uncharacterized protein n=2 Tax=Necator americanus TaxID=51031 RepID=A0ABR1CMF3_NECAM|nr:hypothetical protein NECAME_00939 [Necator americanus]ETN71250.1 hypothetical protein NECAME_00939 [Necator americanus]